MPATAAMERMQASAARVFRRFGGTRVFQEYALPKDWEAGEETPAATGAPVTAASQWTTTSVLQGDGDAKVRVVIRVLHVERAAFGARELTSDWRFVDDDGAEKRIQKAVLSDDQTYWIVTTDSAGAVL